MANTCTPWMIACDQKDYTGLEKLRDSYFDVGFEKDSLGHVLCASEVDGGNTALHYAALSDFSKALNILGLVLSHQQEQDDRFDAVIKLLSQGNHNGDTPIMMLCVNDFANTLDCWLEHAIQTGLEQGLSWKHIQAILAQILQLENSSQDTALSLAYGHGNNRVMECLLQDRISTIQEISTTFRSITTPTTLVGNTFLLQASHQDMEKCKRVLEKVNVLIHTLQKRQSTDESVSSMIQQGLQRKEDIKRSLVLLQDSCSKLAQRRMTELLELDDSVDSEKKKDTRRKKSSKILGNPKTIPPPDDNDDGKQPITVNSVSIDKSNFTTLIDGTIVSQNTLREQNVGLDDSRPSLDENWNPINNKSTKDLLNDRCSESHHQRNDGRSVDDDVSIEASLKSLCLEPCMLLLTAHGMALQLSPSQLEAVELLLKNQLDAVGHAKEIQSRLLSECSSIGS